MLEALALLVLGGGLLYLGGDWLIDGTQVIAQRLGLSTLFISIVIIGFGTSIPELLVAINATLDDRPDIAVGNVVGSNIANLLLVMALTALIFPLNILRKTIMVDGTVVIGVSLLYILLGMDGNISRGDGFVLILTVCAYLLFRAQTDEVSEDEDPPTLSSFKTTFYIVAGLLALPLGAKLFLAGALDLATYMGLSDEIIGLTVVAFGTSVPELATCIIAALKRKADIVVGNILGSNIFNLTLVIGGAALVNPLAIASSFINLSHPLMLASIILSLILMTMGWRLSRLGGSIMLGCYGMLVGFWVM